MPKKLFIQVSSSHNDQPRTVPINSGTFVELDSEIGLFSVSIDIKNFDKSSPHKDNSFYNRSTGSDSDATSTTTEPNLRIFVKFKPSETIPGSELLFGNDCGIQISDNIPTSLISTGLHFFKWFINPTINCDMYSQAPYIYGLALNSFTKMGKASLIDEDQFISQDLEKLSTNEEIPSEPGARQKFYCQGKNFNNFSYDKGETYYFLFDTVLIKLGDSIYHVSIPTFGSRTFDIDVLKYADDKVNNFNWTIKKGGLDDAYAGEFGLLVNFSLLEES